MHKFVFFVLGWIMVAPRVAAAQEGQARSSFVDDPWESPRVSAWMAERGVGALSCSDRLFWGLALEEREELVAAARVFADCARCPAESGQACREGGARVVRGLTELEIRLEGAQPLAPPGSELLVDGVPRPEGLRRGIVLVSAGVHHVTVRFPDGRRGAAELGVPRGVPRLVVPILPVSDAPWWGEDDGPMHPARDEALAGPWAVAAVGASLGGASGFASLATFVASRAQAERCVSCDPRPEPHLAGASTGLLVGAGVGVAVSAVAALVGLSTDDLGRIELGGKGLHIRF